MPEPSIELIARTTDRLAALALAACSEPLPTASPVSIRDGQKAELFVYRGDPALRIAWSFNASAWRVHEPSEASVPALAQLASAVCGAAA